MAQIKKFQTQIQEASTATELQNIVNSIEQFASDFEAESWIAEQKTMDALYALRDQAYNNMVHVP
ncbi:hypothetical protein E4P24_02745 [Haloferax sp. AS1]|uniref:hypothetical protein n=1 Tax=Haloferax sp. AS1 TaxID=2562277 RepID=UPI00165F6149|nr:hypothetical protein [Haloferax sp. AS1]MBC9985289.1 hypothetical protein [Haloferax sp. AS1]